MILKTKKKLKNTTHIGMRDLTIHSIGCHIPATYEPKTTKIIRHGEELWEVVSLKDGKTHYMGYVQSDARYYACWLDLINLGEIEQ